MSSLNSYDLALKLANTTVCQSASTSQATIYIYKYMLHTCVVVFLTMMIWYDLIILLLYYIYKAKIYKWL